MYTAGIDQIKVIGKSVPSFIILCWGHRKSPLLAILKYAVSICWRCLPCLCWGTLKCVPPFLLYSWAILFLGFFNFGHLPGDKDWGRGIQCCFGVWINSKYRLPSRPSLTHELEYLVSARWRLRSRTDTWPLPKDGVWKALLLPTHMNESLGSSVGVQRFVLSCYIAWWGHEVRL